MNQALCSLIKLIEEIKKKIVLKNVSYYTQDVHKPPIEAKTALPIQPLLVCVALLSRKKADCDVAAVPSAVQPAGRCSVYHIAHARPTMPSISLVL